jgi:serine/threonine-protein kinase RIO1
MDEFRKDTFTRRDMVALVHQAFVGRYEVERAIGRGRNARILLATDSAGQRVALRVLHPELLRFPDADELIQAWPGGGLRTHRA